MSTEIVFTVRRVGSTVLVSFGVECKRRRLFPRRGFEVFGGIEVGFDSAVGYSYG